MLDLLMVLRGLVASVDDEFPVLIVYLHLISFTYLVDNALVENLVSYVLGAIDFV
jgi:hypothetical protein